MSHAAMYRLSAVFYALLALAGGGWILWRDGLAGLTPAPWPRLALGALEGTAGGLAVVLVWAYLARVTSYLREFEESLAAHFRGMALAGTAWLALASAVGEELLFRGGVQGSFGLWLASAAFALVHVPLRREIALWPVFAFSVGLLLGWIYDRNGSLAAPIAGHFTVNFINLTRMARGTHGGAP